MPRLPHETVTVLVRLVETSFFLVEYVQSLRISDDLGLLTCSPPPPSFQKPKPNNIPADPCPKRPAVQLASTKKRDWV